jgi:hypothetical protein
MVKPKTSFSKGEAGGGLKDFVKMAMFNRPHLGPPLRGEEGLMQRIRKSRLSLISLFSKK